MRVVGSVLARTAAQEVGLRRSPWIDVALLAIVIALTALYAFFYVDFSLPPAEDAAMLMRYAGHLATGGGMVWNTGEAPVDGATDFLFVIVVAGFHRFGLSLEHAVLVPTVAAHFAMVALIYAGLRYQGAAGLVAAATALYVALGPGLVISAAYFGATFFALVLALAWLLGQRLVLRGRRRWSDCLYFALTALVAALVRPEGFVMALFMTVGFCATLPWRTALRLALVVAVVFFLLGGVYFLWRWHYFGHPLPNPLYRRGRWTFDPREWAILREHAINLGLPFLVASALALASPRSWRLAIGFAIPLVGFAIVWGLFSNAQNFAGRYQYPLLPLAALSWYPPMSTLVRDIGLAKVYEALKWARAGASLLAVVGVAALLIMQLDASRRIGRDRDGKYEMGMLLEQYANRSYSLATSEAGLLPLYSRWRTLDTWGLNDAKIALRGRLTEEDLERYHPAIVMWHDHGSLVTPPAEYRVGPWADMVTTLQRYVDARGFVLAADFGIQPDDTHYYWVAPDIPECEELVTAIRALPYAWLEGGAQAKDFAAGLPGRTCGS